MLISVPGGTPVLGFPAATEPPVWPVRPTDAPRFVDNAPAKTLGLPQTTSACGGGDIRWYDSAARSTVWRVVDALFAERRLAELRDPLDPDRSDLDVYAAMVDEFGVRSVLDIGCGTGTFACLLARRGLAVTALDPAEASLEIARAKPGADRVQWARGFATDLPCCR